jgi:hypothetical protein
MITTNQDQEVFVIPSSSGYSCLGFQNCFDHTKQLSELLSRPDLSPNPDEIGQVKQYELYQQLTRLALSSTKDLGTYFDPNTGSDVRYWLEHARQNHLRLRLFLGDRLTGRDWLEEFDVIGTIGRSMGPLKVPLLIRNAQSCGGAAISTSSIVRIVDVKTKRERYRHAKYHQPVFSYVQDGDRWAVMTDNQLHARFSSERQAKNWIAFMRGERMCA